MMKLHGKNSFLKRLITGAVLLALVPLAIIKAPSWLFSGALLMLFAYLCYAELPRLIRSSFWLLVVAVGWIGIPFLLWALLQKSYVYCWLALFTVLITSAHDTGAYLIGKCMGNHKLWPSVSPGKTWEGVLGGFISCLVALILWCYYLNRFFSLPILCMLAFTLSLAATVGDLAESALKRSAGVKDSGSLLPGHGGIFDRIDSLLATIVVVYFLRTYLMGGV